MGSTKTRATSHFLYVPHRGAAEHAEKALARTGFLGYAVREK